MKQITHLLLITLTLLAAQIALQAQQLPSGITLHREQAYIEDRDPRHRLDVYELADGQKHPLIIWIHGGGWEMGNKENPSVIGLLWSKKYSLASLNYRLTTQDAFPAQIQDVKAAVRWLRANAAKFHLDEKRFAVVGASAGGHLAALLGTSSGEEAFEKGPHLNQSSAVQAVVDFYGPSDLSLYGASRPGDTLSRLIGGPIQIRRKEVQQANPITYIDKTDPPFFLCHGDRDTLVPPAHSQKLHEALQKAGVSTELLIVPGAGHSFIGGFNQNDRIIAFLDRAFSTR
ncbi:MAG: alpha/beta hydrolase [Verrucomicrobia bacterium]|nr:alpha/beta hydrolase [Verrucomicrobiota bacterium]